MAESPTKAHSELLRLWKSLG